MMRNLTIDIKDYLGRQTGANRVDIGPLSFWFLHRSCIAFSVPDGPGFGMFVCENVWGALAGLALNKIDTSTPQAKERRLPRREFLDNLNSLIAHIHIDVGQWKPPRGELSRWKR